MIVGIKQYLIHPSVSLSDAPSSITVHFMVMIIAEHCHHHHHLRLIMQLTQRREN